MKRLLIAATLIAASTGLAAAHDTTPLEREMERQSRNIEDGRRMGELDHREFRQLQDEQNRITWMLDNARADGTVTRIEYRAIEEAQSEATQSIATHVNNDHVAHWRVRSSDQGDQVYETERPRYGRWGQGRWGWGYGRRTQDQY